MQAEPYWYGQHDGSYYSVYADDGSMIATGLTYEQAYEMQYKHNKQAAHDGP